MEIVINKCFGGFGLSTLAISKLLERKGIKSYCYKQIKFEFSDGKDEFIKVAPTKNSSMCEYILLKDYGDSINGLPWEDKTESSECVEKYFSSYDTDRTDPDLIAIVKELGTDASSSCSSLGIVNIPDHIKWEISDYDGLESVEEKHRSWS